MFSYVQEQATFQGLGVCALLRSLNGDHLMVMVLLLLLCSLKSCRPGLALTWQVVLSKSHTKANLEVTINMLSIAQQS